MVINSIMYSNKECSRQLQIKQTLVGIFTLLFHNLYNKDSDISTSVGLSLKTAFFDGT